MRPSISPGFFKESNSTRRPVHPSHGHQAALEQQAMQLTMECLPDPEDSGGWGSGAILGRMRRCGMDARMRI